jgi:hypothetical protein
MTVVEDSWTILQIFGQTHPEPSGGTVVKLTSQGASLQDPAGLFNASLEGNTRRAIDIREGEAIDEDALRALIRAAVSLNESAGRAPKKRRNGA